VIQKLVSVIDMPHKFQSSADCSYQCLNYPTWEGLQGTHDVKTENLCNKNFVLSLLL